MAQDQNKESLRKAVIKVASKCFEEHGVKKTTMPTIAAQAGMDLKELKSLFKSKSLLTVGVQNYDLEKLKRKYIANMPNASLGEMVKFIMQSRCEFIEKHNEQTMLVFSKALLGREPWSKMLDSMLWQLSIEFAALFEKSVREGEIRKDVDIHTVVRALMSFYLTGIVIFGLRAGKFETAKVWNVIEPQIDLLLDGLKV